MYSVIELKQTKTFFTYSDHAREFFDSLKKQISSSAVVLLSDDKLVKSHNYNYFSFQKPQAQYDTKQQLRELVDLANRNGLYDAADVVSRYLDKTGI